jgi:O-antigen ligase
MNMFGRYKRPETTSANSGNSTFPDKGGLASKIVRRAFPFAILILPILKDGPLDIDLETWKLVCVGVLFFLAFQDRSAVISKCRYTHVVILVLSGIAATIVSYGLSSRQSLATPLTQSYLLSSLFFLITLKIFKTSMLRTAVRSIIVLTIGVCIVAFVQYATIFFKMDYHWLLRMLPPEARTFYFDLGNSINEMGVRLPSVFFHANQLGHVLSLSFGFLFPFFLASRSNRNRLVYLCVIVMIGACTLLTLSRGALLVMSVEFTVVLALNRKIVSKKPMLLVVLSVLLAASVFTLIGNVGPFLSRFFSSGLSYRDTLWVYALQLIPEYFLFGVGPGCSSFEILTRFPLVDYSALLNLYYIGSSFDRWGSAPHNYYLTTLLEGGVFILFFRLLLYLWIFRRGIMLIRRLRHEPHRSFAIAATVPLGSEFIRGFFDSYSFMASMESGALVAVFVAIILFIDSGNRAVLKRNVVATRIPFAVKTIRHQ